MVQGTPGGMDKQGDKKDKKFESPATPSRVG
jgi:hypothetical protein